MIIIKKEWLGYFRENYGWRVLMGFAYLESSKMVKKRTYPKVLQLYMGASTPEGHAERFYREMVVWNDTEFESYKSHNQRYILKERTIKWRDLKDINFFSRVYHTFPIGMTYTVGGIFGFAVGHLDTLIKYGKVVYQMLFQ